jgi:predicted PolB exonuclease-like 3'-5' exonuclease
MLNKQQISKFLYLDVETACIESNFTDLENSNPRLAKLWEKRCEYYKNSSEDLKNLDISEIYLKKASLEPEFSRIVCISFGSFNDSGEMVFKSFYGDDELDILEKTNKVLSNAYSKGWKLCGHNIKGFDVPTIGKRMLFNGINPPPNLNIWDKKPWEIPYVDTAEVFSFGNWVHQRYLSLDLLSCSLGVDSPKDSIDGSMVNEVYWINKDYELIKNYCESDVKTVMVSLDKICF